MALKKLALKTTHEHAGKRLDQVLAEWLPQALSQPLSKAKVRKLVVAGAVYLNGRRVRIASKQILASARIDAYVDLAKLLSDEPARDQLFEMRPQDVLFEDEFLIVVNKPPGLPTQPTLDESRNNLFAAVKKFLAARDRVAQPYLGLHHRLDRDTSGVVLFTKDARANAGAGELFSRHLAEKTYVALSVRPPAKTPEPAWETRNYLGRDKAEGKRSKFRSVRSGGDFAHTRFRLLETLSGALLIEARPKTGRTHQIRVHLAEDGYPILGDATYGGPREPAPRLMLHAARLEFPHPITREPLRVESPLPEDFAECLRKLRGKS